VLYLQLLEKKQLKSQNRGRAQSGKLRKSYPGLVFFRCGGTAMNCNNIRRLAASALLIVAPFSVANAADMALKAPPPAPVAAPYNWTGFYLGGNVGYGWGHSSNNWNFLALGNSGKPLEDLVCAPNGFALCVSGSNSNALDGVIGGFQFGYNWQMSNVLVGLETDFQLSGQKGTAGFSAGWPQADNSVAPLTATNSEKLLWLGTLRGRVGLIASEWLIYTTGGLAYGRVTNNGSAALLGQSFGPSATPCPGVVGGVGGVCPLGAWSNGTTKVGWTIGLGVERAIGGNWSWKAEYLFVDLGSINTAFSTVPGNYGSTSFIATLGPGTGTIGSRITDNIFRVGLNYQLH
jgi:outer membrane immunogenic protein